MKKVRQFSSLHGQTIVSALAILAVVVGLLGFQLGTLTPGMSKAEVLFIESSTDIGDIVANPLNGLMKLPLWALQYFEQASPLTTRAVGAFFGVLTIVLFYFVMRRWHTRRISLLAAFMFIVSSWFLQISRLALPYILLAFGVAALIAIAAVIHDRHTSRFGLVISTISIALLLYIPGMAWFVLILLLWQLADVKKVINDTTKVQKALGLGLLLILLAPLGYAFYRDVSLMQAWLGLPTEYLVVEWLRRILVLPIFLTAQGPLEPVYNLGRLPLLDVFTTVMVVIGIYSYYFKAKLRRTVLLVLMAIVATLLIALNGPDFLPLLLPLVFIVAGAGLTLLLQQWFTVFPRNPLARTMGVLTIALVIGITGVYHIRRYFVAWSGNPDTRSEFIYLLDE